MNHLSPWTRPNPVTPVNVEVAPIPQPLQPVVIIAGHEPLLQQAGTPVLLPAPRRRVWPWFMLAFCLGGLAVPTVFTLARDQRAPAPVAKATVAPMEVCLLEEGALESADVAEVKNPVKVPGVKLKSMLPFGTRVREGQTIAQLDLAPVQTAIAAQEAKLAAAKAKVGDAREAVDMIRTKAEGDLAAAQLQVELAHNDLDRYVKSEKVVELTERRGALAMAERDLRDAEDKLKHYRTFHKRGFITAEQLKAREAEVARLGFNLRQNQARLKIFESYLIPKQERQLQARVEEVQRELARTQKTSETAIAKAEQDLAAAEAAETQETQTLAAIQTQAELAELKAPRSGVLCPPLSADAAKVRPAVGGTLEPGQVVFSLPDLGKLRVKVRVAEEQVKQLRPGQPVRVQLDPDADVLLGALLCIEFQTEPTIPSDNSAPKDFVASVTVPDTPLPSTSKLGQRARVEIPVGQKENTLQVPLPAVAEVEGKHFAWVVAEDGLQQREVRVGASDGKNLEVKDGLAEGEEVVLHPRQQMADPTETAGFFRSSLLNRWFRR